MAKVHAEPIHGRDAHAAAMAAMFEAFPDVHIERWEGDLLVEEYVFWDSALMTQQIGLG